MGLGQGFIGKTPQAAVLLCFLSSPVFAQSTTRSTNLDQQEDQTKTAGISDTMFSGARAHGMGYTLAPFADGLDAAVYNPAGIGGLHHGSKKPATLRHFHFPYAASEVNENSQNLIEDVTFKGGATKLELANAVTEATEGRDQFGRASLVPDIAFGRMILVPLYDNQISAVQISEDSEEAELLYQNRLGFGLGLSFTDASETLYLGAFSSYSTLKRTTGFYTAEAVADPDTRGKLFSDNTETYSGNDTTVGFSWKITKTAAPVLSITTQHTGNTEYVPSDSEADKLIDKQILTVAFGASPPLGKWGFFNFGLAMTDLDNEDLALSKKWRAGAEFNFGSHREKPWLGFRAGASPKGFTYGANICIGLVGAQYANFPEEIGTDDEPTKERRQAALLFVDLGAD